MTIVVNLDIELHILFLIYIFQIVFRVWKIVPPTRADSHTPPAEYKNSHQEFEYDDRCHSMYNL